MSFLSVFTSILHATEAAAAIAAPVIATVDPQIGFLMQAATLSAVGVEQAIQAPGQGAQKAQIVQEQTQASINVINSILASQGKQPLPASTGQVVATQVGVVVGNLNAIEAAVKAAPPAKPQVVAGIVAAPVTQAPPPPPPPAS